MKNLDLTQYVGKWVAVSEGKVVASAAKVKTVVEEVNKLKIKKALYVPVPKQRVNLY